MSDLREFLDRGADGATEVDLVEGVWRTSRRRRRNRRLGAGSAVAAVAAGAVVVSQWGGAGPSPEDLAPAVDTGVVTSEPAPVDTLAANQRFLDGIRASGVQFDYELMESPGYAVGGGLQILVGEVEGVRANGHHFVVTVEVEQSIPDVQVAEHVDAFLEVETLHDLTQADLDAVGGQVLLVLPDQPRNVHLTPKVFPAVDGFWLDVPDGIGNPYVDYSEMGSDWPPVDSVAELSGMLSETHSLAQAGEQVQPIECSASWQNPPPLNSIGLTPAALDTANELVRLAAYCDEAGLIARALADGTEVAVGEGEVAEQLAIPDPNRAYVRLEGTLAVPVDSEPGLHAFELEGWRVVIASDGRWVEFTRE
ncbi:MAG: hypothetical protein GX555_03880 [Actinomycetales bacterium]|nr:hypothetical protein [Actinomycetales bacterium]